MELIEKLTETSVFSLNNDSNSDLINLVKRFEDKYRNKVPVEWGEKVYGIKTRFSTSEPVIALTFDACGRGGTSNGYDQRLIDYLRQQNIPATLFITGNWIDANPKVFYELASDSLFEIENHGLRHMPCSINGKSIYGIQGTESIADVIEEVELNARRITTLTGRKPHLYRSGTAYYDEIAVGIVKDLGYEVVNFNVLGDKGATYKKSEVKHALISANQGSIVILHMNHPEGETAQGVIEAVPILLEKGFRFVKLSDYPLE